MESRKNNPWEEEREIRIKVSPKSLLKKASFIILFIFVFYLGRWTAPGTGDISMATETIANTVAAPDTTPKSEFSISGWVTGLFSSDTEETTPTTTTAVETEETPAADSTAASATPAASTTASTENISTTAASSAATGAVTAEEDVITTYNNKLALALTSVKKDWKETWGKITSLDVTIKNNEAGTVKSAYFMMGVEGYEDADKKIVFIQTIKPGKTLQYAIPVPHGFAYNTITAGDLTSVEITLELFDASDKLISTTKNNMNLQG